ncbi:patatin-like protein 1 [Vigna radiata var. radiata]|uniref:Patatin n=1 Tax=Vigna radiata var. radiata TaxID=3916 RepID=A0A3Q0FC18_VIGRR|nr:patatin-like protein 1 [Vigna radiata var. radiata]
MNLFYFSVKRFDSCDASTCRQHLITCPRYDGKFLKRKTVELLRETRLNETLTNVVIPTFDEKKIQPVIFSSYKLKTESYLNAKLSDIGLGTSAAPTYLPNHVFQNDGVKFDLIDGALAANNPALVAVSEVIQKNGQKEILLLSLGTGITAAQNKLGGMFDGVCQLGWLAHNIEVISEVAYSTDMTHYYLATIFPGLLPAKNYLRIEEYNMDPSLNEMDNTDKKNMDNLEKVGKGLLTQKVKRMNVNSFKPFELDQTNSQALDRLAEKVFAERQLRLKRKYMEKGGRPLVETAQVLSG